MKIRTIEKKQWILYICLGGYLTTVLSIFAFTTSPLYPNDYGYDSAIFRLIGSYILKGKLPYIDIWDHKGPVLYFIQALGAIHGTNNGKISFIYLMQQIAMFFSVILLYRIDCQINPLRTWKKQLRFFILVIFAVTYLCFIIDGGNISEDWSVPMICCSLYLFTKYAMNVKENVQHLPWFALVHGICFSLVAFIRINNAISICAGLVVIGIYLIIHKQWKNLCVNILFGIIGITVIAAPVCLFFYSRHALDEMIHAVFIFNLKYSRIRAFDISYDLKQLIRFAPVGLSFLFIIFNYIRTKNMGLLDFIAVAIVTGNAMILLHNSNYPHYFIIYFPVYLFIMILYLNLKNINILENLLCLVLFGFCFFECIETGKVYFRTIHDPTFPTANLYLPKTERDSAIAVGVTPEIYLQTGITPCSRFIATQGLIFHVEPGFYEEFKSDLQTKKPKWIITQCDKNEQMTFVSDLLEQKYEYRFSDVPYCFYRLLEP